MIRRRLYRSGCPRLRDIAAAHGESGSDAARRMVEKAVTGESSPSPSPAQELAIPGDIAEMRNLYVCLAWHEEEMRHYVSALGGRMNDVQGVVSCYLWGGLWDSGSCSRMNDVQGVVSCYLRGGLWDSGSCGRMNDFQSVVSLFWAMVRPVLPVPR